MDLETRVASIEKRLNFLESETDQIKRKLDNVVAAKRVLTEVLMNLVAESGSEARD